MAWAEFNLKKYLRMNQVFQAVYSVTVADCLVWKCKTLTQRIRHTRLGCFYVTAIWSWGYGWGWVEVDIEAEVDLNLRLKWGWVEV